MTPNHQKSKRQRTRQTGLRPRIFLSMLLVAVVPLVVMTYQGYHCARQAIIDGEEVHLQSVLFSHRARIHAWLQERERDVFMLSQTQDLVTCCAQLTEQVSAADASAACQILQTTLKSDDQIRQVTVYNEAGEAISSAPSAAGDKLLPLAEDYRLAIQSVAPQTVSRLKVTPDGTALLGIGAQVSAGAEKSCLLVADFDLLLAVDEILASSEIFQQSGRLYLVPMAGMPSFPAAVRSDLLRGPENLPPELFDLAPGTAFPYRNELEVPVLGATAPLQPLGWQLVAEKQREEAFSWLRALQYRAAVTGVFVLVLVLLMTRNSARRLALPFQRLSTVANRVAEGKHDERVQELEGREAQDVGVAFNRMLDEMEETHRQLMHTASLAAVGQLSSSIVHEIRNPLASIKLNLDALRRVQQDPGYSELADIAHKQSVRMERMLSDLLTFGKPLPYKPEDLVVPELLNDVMETVSGKAKEAGVQIDIRNTLPENTLLRADHEQVVRALSNLLLNAVQASPAGSAIEVAVNRETASDVICFTIRDHGPGIPTNARQNLFDPFFTTREEGTGLGLAIVKKIAEYHDGSVTGKNHPDGGAIFTFKLPSRVWRLPPAERQDES